jgi:hypothetical protein
VSVTARIRELLVSDEWERRLPALEVARRRVLEEYQLFPFLASAIRHGRAIPGPKEEVTIPGYRTLRWRHRARYIRYMIRAGQARDLGNVFWNKLKYLRWFGV